MIGRRGSRCLEHRAALLDFVDRREIGPSTDPALDHLDRCHDCEVELIDVALAITALRRMQVEAGAVEPSQDAWVRIRACITRRPVALWRWRMTLAGLVTSATLVGVLAGPASIVGPADRGYLGETSGEPVASARLLGPGGYSRIEAEFIAASRRPPSSETVGSTTAAVRANGSQDRVVSVSPHWLEAERKEVEQNEASLPTRRVS